MDLCIKRQWKKEPKNPWFKLIRGGKGGGAETCNAHIQKGKRELTEWEKRKEGGVGRENEPLSFIHTQLSFPLPVISWVNFVHILCHFGLRRWSGINL